MARAFLIMLAQSFEESMYGLDVGRRIRIENCHVVEAGHDLLQT